MKSKLKAKKLAVTCLLLGASIFSGGYAHADDKSGTDPRGFGSKFMPYNVHTVLENGLEVDQLHLFGMYGISPKFAITYDLPVWSEVDFSDVSGPLSGKESGVGDLNLRFLFKPDATQLEHSSHLFGLELTLPTASDPKSVLGGDTTVASFMYIYTQDVKLLSPGFVAMMNIYDFDIDKGDNGSNVNRYRGRWFLMQPLTRPGPKLADGLYLLPELQPVYDWDRNDDKFSLWIAPELGKMLPWGTIYLKPGFGIVSDDESDRDWTFEVGLRYFFK